MIKYINECCYCAVPGYPCNNQHKRVPYFECDKCGDEVEDLYEYDSEQLCESCLLDTVEKVVIE